MTYAGGKTYPSPIIHAGSLSRVHASAQRRFAARICANSALRSGITLSLSDFACLANTALKNRFRCFGGIVSRYAPTSISMVSNSTVTRGISSARDGGNSDSDTTITPNSHALPGAEIINCRNLTSRKRRMSALGQSYRANPICRRETRPQSVGGRGPMAPLPPGHGAAFIQHGASDAH